MSNHIPLYQKFVNALRSNPIDMSKPTVKVELRPRTEPRQQVRHRV